MKFVKRITALFLAMVMVMAMGITAFADTTSECSITGPADLKGHTYSIYQIFTGTYDSTTGKLSDIKWGSNAQKSDGSTVTTGDAVDEATLNAIAGISATTDQGKADEIAKYVNFSSTTSYEIESASQKVVLPAGYYLVKDNGVSGENATTDAYSTYVVKVVGSETLSPKTGTPEFEKKIKDTNDTTGGTSEWQDSADYDIGDAVPFQLKGTLPSNYDSYTTYYCQFSDQMEKGLTFDSTAKSNVKVYAVNGENRTDITSSFTVSDPGTYTYTDPTKTDDSTATGTTFTVTCNNLKSITGATITKDTTIVVEYTATLNSDAVLGSTGNVNEAKLIYSNNPNNSGEGSNDHGETPWDNVIVFTYKVVVKKVDNNSTALAGAAFKLEKEIKAAEEGTQNTWTTIKEFSAGDATSFTFSGLDDGNYRLTETTTPAGYNTINPITFTVTAEHNIVWTTGERTDVLTSLNGNRVSGEITFTSNKTEGSLSADVVNKPGSNLPSTGGMGTTILYVAGVVLIVVAGVVIIRRKNA